MLVKVGYVGDISLRTLDNGLKDFDLAIETDFVKQKIKEDLLTFLNECFVDLRIGFPYKEEVFINSPDLNAIKSLFNQAILKTPGVAKIKSMTLEFERSTRILYVNFVAILNSNEELEVDSRRDIEFILQF